MRAPTLLPGLILLVGCRTVELAVGDHPGSDEDTGGSDSASVIDTAETGDATDTAGDLDEACADIAPIPVHDHYLPGYTGAEDFAFDADGYLVSIDQNGNLVGVNQDGQQRVIVAHATNYGAGTHFLPDGDIVYCDVEAGSLVRADPETGGTVIVLGGLEYPNGLDVDLDGFVYVSEQNAGRVRRIDPNTGDYTVILTGLYQPNGVTFAPGFNRIFVGSFGAGVVWASDRIDDTTWTDARVYAMSPEAPGVPPDWCDSHLAGEACPLESGYSLGECADDGSGDLSCVENYDFASCIGKAEGDACTSDVFGAPVGQTCHSGKAELWCPRSPTAAEAACAGKTDGESCGGGRAQQCSTSFEGLEVCWDYNTYYETIAAVCDGEEIGVACSVPDTAYPSVGLCADGAVYGFPGNICLPPGSGNTHGGLDAINVDECGNLYVSEYIMGEIWRFTDEGLPAEEAAALDSQWIPNMHWGNGRGGWDENTLYVMDRVDLGVFALPLNIGSHGDAYTPGNP